MLERQDIFFEARNKWAAILMTYGIEEKFLNGKHGPCPLCGGVDRFRFDNKNGDGTYFCSNCGAAKGINLLMKFNSWDFKEAVKEVRKIIGSLPDASKKSERTEEEKILSIKRVLKESKKVEKNDPVWTYLNSRTGIYNIPKDIRFHESLPHSSGGNYPAMVSIMRNSKNEGVSIHRTYLSSDGKKANVSPAKKFMQGKSLTGSAVRLSKICDHMGIAEGIETALAASVKFDVPMFAATNALLMSAWMPPDGVKSVMIFGDNDESYTGHAAAYTLAKRLHAMKIDVSVTIHPEVGHDFAD